MPLSAVDAIHPAMERAKSMLVRPFRFKTWLKIGFIGWLAGGASSSGNYNFGNSLPQGRGGDAGTEALEIVRSWIHDHLLLIALGVALLFAIGLVVMYLSCRFRFILFDTVVEKSAEIGRGWRRYSLPAQRYFAFQLAFVFISLAVFGAVLGIPLWRAYKRGVFSGNDPFAFLRVLLPLLLAALALVVLGAIINSLAGDFGVPILALDNATLGGAWRLLRQMISAEPGAFAVYLLVKLGLSIAAGIATVFAAILIFLILLIPGIILAVIGVVIILAILGGAAAFAVFIVISLMLTAPIATFFTSYALYFFGGRYSALAPLLWPQPPAPAGPVVPAPPPAIGPAASPA